MPCAVRLTRTTRAAVFSAIPATALSSALRITTPDAGTALGSSDFVATMASRDPNSPKWAVPTFTTTATDGGAIAASSAMFPGRPRRKLPTPESLSSTWP